MPRASLHTPLTGQLSVSPPVPLRLPVQAVVALHSVRLQVHHCGRAAVPALQTIATPSRPQLGQQAPDPSVTGTQEALSQPNCMEHVRQPCWWLGRHADRYIDACMHRNAPIWLPYAAQSQSRCVTSCTCTKSRTHVVAWQRLPARHQWRNVSTQSYHKQMCRPERALDQ
jgi:hypothetical protein